MVGSGTKAGARAQAAWTWGSAVHIGSVGWKGPGMASWGATKVERGNLGSRHTSRTRQERQKQAERAEGLHVGSRGGQGKTYKDRQASHQTAGVGVGPCINLKAGKDGSGQHNRGDRASDGWGGERCQSRLVGRASASSSGGETRYNCMPEPHAGRQPGSHAEQ